LYAEWIGTTLSDTLLILGNLSEGAVTYEFLEHIGVKL
jgi:hypothetical protein